MLTALERRIKSGILRPQQKYPYAQTANQEYGWDGGDCGTLMKPDPNRQKGIKSTPITGYVENYYLTRGINPFKVRDRIPKSELITGTGGKK